MSKSLSEQVAELQDLFDKVCATAEARKETIAALEAENAELRAGRGRWPKLGPAVAPTVPRLIAADELESGAKVATFTDQGRPVAGTVIGEVTGKVRLLLHNDNLVGFDTERTFILLEDAPDEQQEPEAEKPGYQKFYDSIGATGLLHRTPATAPTKPVDTSTPTCKENGENFTREQEPERLTVADLENAPVGSVLSSSSGSRFAQKFTKYATGVWDGDLTAQQYTSRELESCGHSVLTYPAPAPVTAETIRASEPGSTWELVRIPSRHYTWTGTELISHQEPEEGDLINYIYDGQLARSTAAPRGDYDTPPRLTVHKLNVAPVGSTLSMGNSKIVKLRNYGWTDDCGYPYTSEAIVATGIWADATLTYPEQS